MSRPTRWAIGILAVIVIAQGVALYLGRRALWEANLSAANERAAHDRTRVRLSGQVLIAERLARQVQVQLDATLRQPERTDQAHVGVEVARKTQVDTVAAAVTVDTSQTPVLVLETVFDGRDSLGVFVGTHSEIRGLGRLSALAQPSAWTRFEVTREPLLLDVGVSCQRQEHGADAVVQVSGPRWATIDITRPEVQPEVCNPKPLAWRPFSLKAPSLPVAAALVGLGYLLAR